MDLRSMLNDSQSQRAAPRTDSHTPHSSYDARLDHTPASDLSSARPTPYGPPLNTGDPRAQGGSYFAMQSPHPNTSASASTPSAGPHSAYAQSPGSYAGAYTPRESQPPANAPTHNAAFVSPSPSVHHPPTPGSAHHQSYHPQHAYPPPQNSYPANYPPQQFQSPPPPQANGLPLSHARQISPANQFQGQPATPLGPPIHYPKASPQAVRPLSQGNQDQRLRRESVSSISSILSKDYNHYNQPVPTENTRRESITRPYPYDVREPSRSESVSPKTIPKPTPQREHSTGSHTLSHGRISLPPQSDPRATMSHQNSFDRPVEPPGPQMPSSNSISSMHERHSSIDQTIHQSPTPMPAVAPREPPQVVNEQTSLKRSASHLSDTKPPPQKRPRGVVPKWAESARGNRPLRFIDAPQHNSRPRQQIQQRPPPAPQNEPTMAPRQNGTAAPLQPIPPQAQGQEWESSIANVLPFPNLTRKICDWIISIIASRPAPLGSTWEIEAKVGAIMNTESGERYFIPEVDSEVLLNRERTRNTRFDSSMNIHQHKALNDYLNHITEESVKARQQNPARHEIFYDHPKENDEFFELSDEGKAQLNPDLQIWISEAARRTHRREVRVRRSTNKLTGEVKAQIIKTRVADKDIYNPDFDFDFRISISLETDWNGAKEHLTPLAESRGRNKDRLSYRHMMYQIDLTQVSHDDSDRLDHELEVEVSTEYLQQELHRLRRGDANNYERMVEGLVDNVRLLCRKGSVGARH